MRTTLTWLAAGLGVMLASGLPAWSSPATLSGELRLHATDRQDSPLGPMAQAHAINPEAYAATPSSAQADLELRSQWKMVSANVLLSHQRPQGGPGESLAQVNELHGSAEWEAWQFSAGRKVVSWDVGYGFRPNDMVQQEQRRTLLGTTPAGRPLLQAEWFNAEQSFSLVWVNPRRPADDSAHRGGDESALAARLYSRLGGLDAFVFGRAGHDTGASLGSAFSLVAGDELELHASARWMARFERWDMTDPSSPALYTSNPWQQQQHAGGRQWLVGANWTGSEQQGLMIEAWHDGSAASPAQWRAWQQRNLTLGATAASPGLPVAALQGVAGNLAWQTQPMNASSLHQDNVFVRLSWQPTSWQYSLDTLYHPADGGRLSTAALQWQGDQWRLQAAWRQTGGPANAVMSQLPTRRSLLLAAVRSF